MGSAEPSIENLVGMGQRRSVVLMVAAEDSCSIMKALAGRIVTRQMRSRDMAIFIVKEIFNLKDTVLNYKS